ncbi:MAG TPA: FmdE family protein [Thermodesulfovibrionales bacterium]|nr:FmdE family protein [Thermodesulfovibrionales bacterium]
MKTFGEVVEFHGHSCPGLALGYRVAKAAMEKLAMKGISEDEELVAIVENDSCAVDAIQVLTGCTFGKGNLIFKDHGKQVYSFIERPSGEAVRIAIDFTPPPETEGEKKVWKRYAEGDRSEDVLQAVHDRKTRKTEAILEASASELLTIKKVNIPLPPEAKIYQSITCARCGEKVAEPRARVKEGKAVCIPCAE